MKTITAYTMEIDDVPFAVEEILSQLDLGHNLLSNSVGLITCYAEFIESGVVKALCDALPFEVIGCTTTGNATAGELGQLMLSILVLTSDEVQFATACSESLCDQVQAPVTEMYNTAAQKIPGRAGFCIGFAPLIPHLGGDVIIKAFDEATGNLPIFGTSAVDHTDDYHLSATIYHGEAYRYSMAIVLLYGEISPKFFIVSVAKERVSTQKSVITMSDGNILMEINGISPAKYLESLGVAENGQLTGASIIPFLVNYNDTTEPVARAVFMLTPEGYAVCGAEMPVNATVSIGTLDYGDVLTTTKASLEKILSTGKEQGLIMFSCIARNLVLGTDSLAEMEVVRDTVKALPYQFSYSGGEICPVYTESGELVNRYHNDTFVSCVF